MRVMTVFRDCLTATYWDTWSFVTFVTKAQILARFWWDAELILFQSLFLFIFREFILFIVTHLNQGGSEWTCM